MFGTLAIRDCTVGGMLGWRMMGEGVGVQWRIVQYFVERVMSLNVSP